MRIFDFHLHPGYDFHNDELGYEITPARFVAGLAEQGVTGCAGSVIHKADSKREVAAYAEILPRLNEEALAFQQSYPSLYVPGIHVHPSHPELSALQIEHYAANGVRLVGELVPYLMGWRNYSDPVLWDILRVSNYKQIKRLGGLTNHTYQVVLENLAKAEELLDEEYDGYSAIYTTKAMVQALHARVALYMQDWETAIDYSTKLIDSDKFMLSSVNRTVGTQNEYQYLWTNDDGYEVIWRIYLTPESYGGVLGSPFLGFNNDKVYYYPD